MTAGRITWISRAVLSLALVVLAALMLGPFQAFEHSLPVSDKQAHMLAFYGATGLALLAFPRMRRYDICLIAVAMGAAVEVAQAMTGRDIELLDIAADAIGAYALMIPFWIEQVRAQYRANPWVAPAYPNERRKPMFGKRQHGVSAQTSPSPAA